jgi:hypothetical protein
VLRQEIAGFRNRLDQRVTETFILKLRSHRIDQLFPECVAAFFVNAAIADHGKFLRARRHENQDAVALASIGHAEFVELFLRRGDGNADRPSLNVNANFPGRFRFRRRDRLHDAVVIEPTQKMFGAHSLLPTAARPATTAKTASTTKSAKAATRGGAARPAPSAPASDERSSGARVIVTAPTDQT